LAQFPKPRRRSGVALTAGVAALALAGAACGSTHSSSSPTTVAPTATTTGSATTAAPTAAAATKVPLVVYAAEGYDSAMAKAFQAATGIPVKLNDDSTGPLITKIQAERNNPLWGLLWVDGDAAFASLDSEGLLLKGWEPTGTLNSVGQAIVPADKSYVPTGVTMAGTLVYDTKTVKTPPTSWQELLSSQWKGQVGMNDPSVSGPTYPFVAGMFQHLGGVSQGEAFYSSLKANGLHIFQTNGDTLHALETGQIKLALIQSSAGIGAKAADPTIATTFLPPVTALPSAIGIDAHVSAAEIAEAKQFGQFVYSAAGQQVMHTGDPQGDSLFWPILAGVAPRSELPPLSSVPSQTLNPYVWGPQESTINTWFTAHIVQ
jgi:iron(III) transport system substrate-binding protein